ncbi:hypothetical protein TcasGA2_TC006338 [Tribolium castaneum]|uniref:THAP-type domain-containing protein n=1 Tax=Tribolium castaneum TaxID=7070 RepID=D6WW62_TRICA|nr:hypothetical protein TcasGA2_TC006338 [Tribolium castaneum]
MKDIYFCSVSNCHTNSRTHPLLSFHPFPPKDTTYLSVSTLDAGGSKKLMCIRKLWEEILLMRTPARCERVCSMHFQKTDYYGETTVLDTLNARAIPTLNLPQAPITVRECDVRSCHNQDNVHKNKHFFTLERNETNWTRFHAWKRFTRACSDNQVTVCSDHFILGFPVDDPLNPDHVPSRNLDLQIEEVDVSVFGGSVSVGDCTREDPLKLTGPEYVGVDPDDIQNAGELPENIFEECIKVEPLDLDEHSVFELGEIKVEPNDQIDHSYCK